MVTGNKLENYENQHGGAYEVMVMELGRRGKYL